MALSMKFNFTYPEKEIKKISQLIRNETLESAEEAAIEHVEKTYNIKKLDKKSIKITQDSVNGLTIKIKQKDISVSLRKKVVKVTPRGVSVMVKRRSPKFIRSAFVAPWQKGSLKRFLFLKKNKLRRPLYTIGPAGMFKSRLTMKVIIDSVNKNN